MLFVLAYRRSIAVVGGAAAYSQLVRGDRRREVVVWPLVRSTAVAGSAALGEGRRRPAGSKAVGRSVGGMAAAASASLSLSLSHSLSYTYKATSPPLPSLLVHHAAIPAGGDGLFSEWRLGGTRRVGELELLEGGERRGRERTARSAPLATGQSVTLT